MQLLEVVPTPIRKQRSARLREAIAKSSRQFRQCQLGREVTVLWESTDSTGPQGWRLHGLTDNYLKVSAFSPQRLWNTFSQVRLDELSGDGMLGILAE